jgi:hypothetical protein
LGSGAELYRSPTRHLEVLSAEMILRSSRWRSGIALPYPHGIEQFLMLDKNPI